MSLGIINENYKSNDDELFMFWSFEGYDLEYEDEEKVDLERIIRDKPVCSFQLLARNDSAHFALKKLSNY